MSGVEIGSLQAEHHESGFGLDSARPRLSWRFINPGSEEDWEQASYELTIKQNGQVKTEEVQATDNVLVPWLGDTLKSREKVSAEVRAKGSDGNWTAKQSIDLEAGLLHENDWEAKVVSGPKIGDKRGPLRPLRFWTQFEWDGKGHNAR